VKALYWLKHALNKVLKYNSSKEYDMTNTSLRNKRNQILSIASKHGASNVRIFGSFARGDAKPKSDIDFLVDVEPERSQFFPGGLVLELEKLLGRHVDVVTEKSLHWYIRERVLAEAVPL
jgi:uncharacterized protein